MTAPAVILTLILTLILSGALVAIAAVHLLWAVGYWFPIREEAALARAVVGTRGVERMPSATACALVVVALLFAAAAPWMPDGRLRTLILFCAAFAFQVRAVLAYAPFWKRATPEQPFRRLDEAFYGPLCIFFGLGFMVLAGASLA